MKFFHRLFPPSKKAGGKPMEIGNLAALATSCAVQAKGRLGAPCVIVVACSPDEEEAMVIGGALRPGSGDKDIVRILERALEAARQVDTSRPPSLPS